MDDMISHMFYNQGWWLDFGTFDYGENIYMSFIYVRDLVNVRRKMI